MMSAKDTGRIVWMAASQITLSGHEVAFIGDAWVPLPSIEKVFTVERDAAACSEAGDRCPDIPPGCGSSESSFWPKTGKVRKIREQPP
jgi:hypothetical protein